MWGKLARRVAADPCVHLPTPAEGVPSRTMRRLHEEIREIRVPSEVLARWALETPVAAQEATGAALAFLVHAEHAATTLLPVPTLLRSEQAILDPDGFLRQPRGAVEHFRMRAGSRPRSWAICPARACGRSGRAWSRLRPVPCSRQSRCSTSWSGVASRSIGRAPLADSPAGWRRRCPSCLGRRSCNPSCGSWAAPSTATPRVNHPEALGSTSESSVDVAARGPELPHARYARGHQAEQPGDEQPDRLARRQQPAHITAS